MLISAPIFCAASAFSHLVGRDFAADARRKPLSRIHTADTAANMSRWEIQAFHAMGAMLFHFLPCQFLPQFCAMRTHRFALIPSCPSSAARAMRAMDRSTPLRPRTLPPRRQRYAAGSFSIALLRSAVFKMSC